MNLKYIFKKKDELFVLLQDKWPHFKRYISMEILQFDRFGSLLYIATKIDTELKLFLKQILSKFANQSSSQSL